MELSGSERFVPLTSEVDCSSMLSMDVEVSIKDGGDNGEVILGEVELVVREAMDSWLAGCWGDEG